MALIRCSECGKEYSSNANMCPMCGCPTTENINNISNNALQEDIEPESANKLRCPRCGSENIEVSIVDVGSFNTGTEKGKIKPNRKKAKYKGSNYTFSNNIQATKALCKNCGKTWTVSQMTEKEKRGCCIFSLVIVVVFIIFVSMVFSAMTSLTGDEKDNKNIAISEENVTSSVIQDTASQTATDFDYDLEGDRIILEKYKGNSEVLLIRSEYDIDGKVYKVRDLLDFNVYSNSVKKIIISEGISELNKSIFNGSEITELYLPKSLTYIYDDTLSYLSQDHIELYYGGSEDEWNAILTKYSASSFSEKLEEGDAEGAGTALADKINKMVGHDLDLSKFTLHFNSKIEDVVE